MKKVRLDQLLVDKGLAQSRERAKITIMEGSVFVDGQRVDKPGTAVDPEKQIEVRGETLAFVSRGGKKLEKALKVFPVDPAGCLCIDCGASTGGFTDVLLQNGAQKVYAVDVGYGQLAWKLREDNRVVNMERTNFRYVTREQIPEEIDFASVDGSFISLRLIVPVMRTLLKDGGRAVCLIKPQFEAGRENVGKKGVVRDQSVHVQVVSDMVQFLLDTGFSVLALDYSPVKGPQGNIEYLVLVEKTDDAQSFLTVTPSDIVAASHEALDQ